MPVSRALNSRSTLLLVQGPPGSGKSIALRQHARKLLNECLSASDEHVKFTRRRPLAIYVNLRRFDPKVISAATLESYIKAEANSYNAAELAEYLRSSDFQADITNGKIVFVLDGFDEIPEIVGSTTIDSVVDPYVRAIESFIGGSQSSCIVASREYKGPRVPGWRSVQLIGLSHSQQLAYLRRRGVSPQLISELKPLLTDQRMDLAKELRFPLALALLYRHMHKSPELPSRVGVLYESYISESISSTLRDDGSGEQLRETLERMAFNLTMSREPGLAVDPATFVASAAVHSHDTSHPLAWPNLLSAALRSRMLFEVRNATGNELLRFGHRRVQEYFATQYVLKHPSSVDIHELATSPQWRETAVTLFQVGEEDQVNALDREIASGLAEEEERLTSTFGDFEWTGHSVHLLELATAALGSGRIVPSRELQTSVDRLTRTAWQCGTLGDKKFALDCLPVESENMQLDDIESAFSGNSGWLRSAALRECGSIRPLPGELESLIRRLIVTLLLHGRGRRDVDAIDAGLVGLDEGEDWIRLRKAVFRLPRLVIAICLTMALLAAVDSGEPFAYHTLRAVLIFYFAMPIAFFWMFVASTPISFRSEPSALRRFLSRVFSRYGMAYMDDADSSEACLYILSFIFVSVYAFNAVMITIDIIRGEYRDILVLALGGVLYTYAWAWGLACVHGFRFSWPILYSILRYATAPWSFVWMSVRTLTEIGARFLIVTFIRSFVTGAFYLTLFYGTFYVLRTYAGWIGQEIASWLSISLTLVLPVLLCAALVREFLSRRRVKKLFEQSRFNDVQGFLVGLARLRDSVEVSDYLRLWRTQKTAIVKRFDRRVIRCLSMLAAGVDDDTAFELAMGNAPQSVALAFSNGLLSREIIRSWGNETLDELGKLDELARAR
ncbi:NACHT domain-containing protein [Nocardia sp. NPDC050175]|uniref:NACHT domain-containing protein n=1 Tax=Nocardia sp. NPDC050175 TaxID=3364317 RepID=UPI00378B0D74